MYMLRYMAGWKSNVQEENQTKPNTKSKNERKNIRVIKQNKLVRMTMAKNERSDEDNARWRDVEKSRRKKHSKMQNKEYLYTHWDGTSRCGWKF